MAEDNSDTEFHDYKEIIKKIENNPINKKYGKFLETIEALIINSKNSNK